MYVGLVEPLKDAAKIRVTYNGSELFTREFAAGDKPELRFETPKETGEAKAFLIFGDKEVPVATATYWFPDVAGARVLMADANELFKANKFWAARSKLRDAIEVLEKVAPDSDEMAEAYLSMCWAHYSARSRKHKRSARKQEACAWYERAIAVWERNGNTNKLSANLTNISVLYHRLGEVGMALKCAVRALKMERASTAVRESEQIAAWTHAAGLYLAVGNLSQASRVISEGLRIFAGDPNCAYLLGLKANVLEARASQLRSKAEEMLPLGACPIR
jgi:tetratricopeptide (TPR) repeat protein